MIDKKIELIEGKLQHLKEEYKKNADYLNKLATDKQTIQQNLLVINGAIQAYEDTLNALRDEQPLEEPAVAEVIVEN
jgi:chromosome segregation ATPase